MVLEAAQEHPDRKRRVRTGIRSEIVLLAEDHTAVGAIASAALTRVGYAVLAPSDGARTLELAAAHGGTVDLLLTNVIMPGMTGQGLAATLCGMRPRRRVFYPSGYTDTAVRHHGSELGDGAFLQKAFTVEWLAYAVRETLDQDQAATEAA